jgi:rubredoxin
MKLKPAAEPDGYYPLVKSPYHHYLYDIAKATPRRIPTVRQHEAFSKMRAALVSTYTCQGCGFYDARHGRSRSGVSRYNCAACQHEIRHRKRQVAICA